MKKKSTLELYTQLKNQFLEKFSSLKAWGNWVSQQRVTAFSEVIDYLEEVEDLLEGHAELGDLIYEDNVAILSGNLVAMPSELKESLAVSANSWHWSSTREQFWYLLYCFKTKQRIASTLLGDFVRHGMNPWCESVAFELDDHQEQSPDTSPDDEESIVMENVISKLRRIRGEIYGRNKAGFVVKSDLLRYEDEVVRFTRRFHENLSIKELSIWNRKVKVTKSDIENSEVSKSSARQITTPRPSKIFENVPVDENLLLEAEMEEEYLVESLPEIPLEVPLAAHEKPVDPDMVLRERLLKLKLFNQAWLNQEKCEQPPQLPKPKLTKLVSKPRETSASDDQALGKVAFNLETESKERVTATEDEIKDFNEWYEAELVLRSRAIKKSEGKSFSNSPLPDTSQESCPSELNVDNNITSSSAAYDSEHECCSCMFSSFQKTDLQPNQYQSTKQDATMVMHLQAILVLLITLSEFIHSNLSTKPSLHTSLNPLSSQVLPKAIDHLPLSIGQLGNMEELRELVRLTRNLTSQWGFWTYRTVWMKVLTMMNKTRKVSRNLTSRDNWIRLVIKVKEIFLE